MRTTIDQMYLRNPLSFFKRDQILVALDKYAYAPGEIIKGSVRLKLKRPLQAKKLTVALIGLRIVHQSGVAVGPIRMGNQAPQTQVYTIYNFEIPLDEEAVYYQEYYPFEIKIPPDILETAQQKFQSTLTGLGKTMSEIAQFIDQVKLTNSRIEWSVEAKLNIPLKIDIINSQKIVLS